MNRKNSSKLSVSPVEFIKTNKCQSSGFTRGCRLSSLALAVTVALTVCYSENVQASFGDTIRRGQLSADKFEDNDPDTLKKGTADDLLIYDVADYPVWKGITESTLNIAYSVLNIKAGRGDIFAGYNENDTTGSTNNTLHVSNSKFTKQNDDSVGLLLAAADTEKNGSHGTYNKLIIENCEAVADNLREISLEGAYVSEGNAENNTVTVTNSVFNTEKFSLKGGYNPSSNYHAVKNEVSALNTTISGDAGIWGGEASGNANENKVKIQETQFTKDSPDNVAVTVYGGQSKTSGTAQSNTVEISASSFSGQSQLYGGYAKNGNADSNTLSVSGTTFNAWTELWAAQTENGSSNGNKLTVSDSESTSGNISVIGSQVTNGDANNNSVSVSSLTVTGSQSFLVTKAAQLTVVSVGTYTSSGNTLSLDNISTTSMSYGNSAVLFDVRDAGNSLTVQNNEVYFGNVAVEQYGFDIAAVKISTGDSNDYATTVSASGNSVYLFGQSDLSRAQIKGVELSGSNLSSFTVSDFSGNNLYFGYNNTPWSSTDYSISRIAYFNNIVFNNAVFGKTITVDHFSGSWSEDSKDYSGVTYVDASNVAFSGVDSIAGGSSYKMLTVTTMDSGNLALTSTTSHYTIGTTLEGDATVSLSDENNDGTNDTVTYTVAQTQVQPEDDSTIAPAADPASSGSDSSGLKTQSQTHDAAMAMSSGTVALNQGGDTTSAAGFNLASSGVSGMQSFSSVGGGSARAETGSHVTLKSLNFSVGIGNNVSTDYGQLSVGAAFEAGYGRFKNHFDAGAAEPYIKKSGHVSYYGTAIVSSFAFDNLWHINGAFRVGRMKSSQRSALYDSYTKQTYDMNISSFYIGTELGGGRVIKFSDRASLDLYAKYFFLYQDGDNFNAGGEYRLKAVKSHRLRVAGRMQHELSAVTALYYGLGAEYEFDGKSRLIVDGHEAEPSKTDGLRAYGELGIALKPEKGAGLGFEFALKGLAGSGYRGAWLSADIKYTF